MLSHIETNKTYRFQGSRVFVTKVTPPTFGRGVMIHFVYRDFCRLSRKAPGETGISRAGYFYEHAETGTR